MESINISIPSNPVPSSPVFLDYLATTPVDPRVLEEMMKYLTVHFGNSTSAHFYGDEPKNAIQIARKNVADLLGCSPENIIFTSGASESNTLAIRGGLQTIKQNSPEKDHIITSSIEHPAVSKVFDTIEGYRVSKLSVDKDGRISLDELKELIEPGKTALVSVMLANNEVGTLQPIKEISKICKENDIIFHSDGAQAVGKLPLNVIEEGVDLLSIAGHKFYAPKGVGALYCKGNFRPQALILGANQECGFRSGTSNVSGIVGIGIAAKLAKDEFEHNHHNEIKKLRDKLELGLKSNFPDAKVNGHPEYRLPLICSIGFPNVKGFELLQELRNKICFSSGAACNKGTKSATLTAMKTPQEYAVGTIRLSLGRYTTEEDIDRAIDLLTEGINSYLSKQ